MARRLLGGVLLILALALSIAFAIRSASSVGFPASPAGARGNPLLFDSAFWLVWAAPFAALLAAGLTRRKDSAIEGDRVLRHDDTAILQHWGHGVATVILLITGFALGSVGLPRFVSGMQPAAVALNVHFVGVILFVFATVYYAANTYFSGRLREHLPANVGEAFQGVIAHYRAVLGGGKFPREGKYFASEHLTYPLAVGASAVVLVTGLVKVLAHSANLPSGLMLVVRYGHDVAAILLGVFLVAHAIAGALVPWSWPLLGSMFTGYVSADYAKHHHQAWYEDLGGVESDDEKRKTA